MNKQASDEKTRISFGRRFFEDHVGHLAKDPYLAVVELIANCYDAGATHVDIVSPSEKGQVFKVSDNGVGMTPAEFLHRWTKLAYSRIDEQGEEVIFPPGVKGKRRALGRSGKGRHGAFCFADSYKVETHKDGQHFAAVVSLTRSAESPFVIEPTGVTNSLLHGTAISGTADRNFVVESKLKEVIGSKFLVDPTFSITLNGHRIDLFALNILNTHVITLPQDGSVVKVHRIANAEPGEDSQMRGVTWWVNRRIVGTPSWQSFSGESYLDARKADAKRISFVVEADFLKPWVKEDWSGFHSMPMVLAATEAVDAYVRKELHHLLAADRRRVKEKAIRQNAAAIGDLTTVNQYAVGKFIDEVQQKCSSLSEKDLARTVEIYANLEQSKYGFDILNQLASCSPDDLDAWNEIMKEWTAANAQIVLGELQRRLKLISRISAVIEADDVDELHEIHPLFERGLWIFGPEYESVDFTSNRGIAQVVGKFFGREGIQVSQKRPDIVAVPNSAISIYDAPSFDTTGMVSGSRSVLIVELKATGIPITTKELDQARNYCDELHTSGAVPENVKIRAFVLGSTVRAKEMEYGNATIVPRTCSKLLDNAHMRTFNLHKRLKQERPLEMRDAVVEELVSNVIDIDQR
ncbi:MAG TPA: ATP-binding protein [Phycisphaerales bacterium]|nr:ATP-binding protein [Phycisphaerales bacterium]